MFNSKKSAQPVNENTYGNKGDTTIIGPSANFDGALKSSGIVRVDGVFSGEMTVDGSIIIGENGFIKGNMRAGKVTIAGKVEGNIYCSGSLELMASGKLFGDMEVKNVSIEDGALFQGKCTMVQQPSTEEYDSSSEVKLLEDNSLSQ